ncbi:hypothetical protein [Streptoalloteichus hindustanus]|uniref:Uncharacterized protein n=1 Tax=Streptoalloteichus hindustanus TaxID=2017 RepID=A0A1M4YHP1_STRHI|nr:hypothetical protein [Streptoalloteichus hindustanus]SHF05315.1 hypothetical protein SAMN05444320_102364 [Streptoalloteichus hindustanus]
MRRTTRKILTAAGVVLAAPAAALAGASGSADRGDGVRLAEPAPGGLVTVNYVDNDSLLEIDRTLNLDQGGGHAGSDVERAR